MTRDLTNFLRAVDQCLDDMQDGECVCPAAKAWLVEAFEPFRACVADDPSPETPTVAVTLRWEGQELYAGKTLMGSVFGSADTKGDAAVRANMVAAAVKSLTDE
jgi:hypothetical protein